MNPNTSAARSRSAARTGVSDNEQFPVTTVVTLFSVIQTFADFQLVYVLTGGGPANATHVFGTYAYQVAITTGLLGEGAAASLAMFPALFVIVVIQLWYIRRVEGA